MESNEVPQPPAPAEPAPVDSLDATGSDDDQQGCGTAQKWNSILRMHTVKRGKTVKLFGPKGERLVTRHRLNRRRLDQTVNKYKLGIWQHGVLEDCRGTLILIPPAGKECFPDKMEYEAIGGGTLFDAIYDAIAEKPNNKHCQALMASGVSNTLILSSNMSDEDITFLKKNHNNWHSGQATTLAEVYRAVAEARAGWRSHCRIHSITVHSCPKAGPYRYEKLYVDYILRNYSDEYAQWEDYDNAKSVYTQLETNGQLSAWLDLLETQCDFSRNGFSNKASVNHAHYLKCILYREKFTKTIQPELLKWFFFECLTATVPLVNGATEFVPFLLDSVCKSKTLDDLEYPMGGSVLYLPQKSGSAAGIKPPKKKQRRSGANEGLNEILDSAEAGDFDSNVTSSGTPKLWVHDVMQCVGSVVMKACQMGTASIGDDIIINSMRKAFRQAIEFFLKTEIMINGKMQTGWSHVRRSAKEELVRTNLRALQVDIGLDGAASSDDILKSMMDRLDQTDSGAASTRPKSSIELRLGKVLSLATVNKGVAFMRANDLTSSSTALCPAFQNMFAELMEVVKAGDNITSLQDLFRLTAPVVYNAVPADLISAGTMIATIMHEDGSSGSADPASDKVVTLSKGLFEGFEPLDLFIGVRTKWNLLMLKRLGCGHDKMTKIDCDTVVSTLLTGDMSKTIAADTMQDNFTSWADYWSKLLAKACGSDPTKAVPVEVVRAVDPYIESILNTAHAGAPMLASPQPASATQVEKKDESMAAKAKDPNADNEDKYEKFHSICSQRSEVTLDGKVEAPVVACFMTQLMAFIYSGAIMGIPATADPVEEAEKNKGKMEQFVRRVKEEFIIKPEAKLDHIGIMHSDPNPDPNTLFVKTPMPTTMRIVFTGDISRVPSKNALPICTAFDQTFYLAPPAADAVVGSTAWHVPHKPAPKAKAKAKAKPEVSQQVQESETNFTCVSQSAKMKFTYNDALALKTETVDVTFYALVPKTNWKHAHDGDIGPQAASRDDISEQ
ncbi:unnamed protein product, partial [Prorocentrum cordatum]